MKRFYHKILIIPAVLSLSSSLSAQVTIPTKPVLLEFRMPETPVDVTSAESLVYLDLKFSSVENLTSAWGKFVSPDGKSEVTFNESGAALAYHLTGTWREGSLRIPVKVPSQVQAGTWKGWVFLGNRWGGSEYGGDGSFSMSFPEGSQPDLTLVNSGIVNTPPVLTAIRPDRETVDVTGGPQKLQWILDAEDDLGVEKLNLSVRREGGGLTGFLRIPTVERIAGTARKGTYRAEMEFPQYIVPGIYIVSASATESGRSNPASLAIPEGGVDRITLINNGERETGPPTLTDIHLSRPSVNVTDAPQRVEATITVENLLTAQTAAWGFIAADGTSSNSMIMVDPARNPETGKVTFTIPLTIPRHSRAGTASLFVSLRNSAGQITYRETGGLPFPAGTQSSIQIVDDAPLPNQPPQLDSFSFTPSTLDKAGLPGLVQFRARLRSSSAITSANVHLDASPSVRLELVEGTLQDGIWTGGVFLETLQSPGEYFSWLSVSNEGGNQATFGLPVNDPDSSDLKYPEGWPAPLLIQPGGTAVDAYQTWRKAFPGLEGTAGDGQEDPDGDGFPNAVEFLCGTDPLHSTLPGGTDPAQNRLFWNPGQLRMEYTPYYPLEWSNTLLGSGTSLRLKAWKSATLQPDSWQPVDGVSAGGISPTLYYPLDKPGTAGAAQFLRLAAESE